MSDKMMNRKPLYAALIGGVVAMGGMSSPAVADGMNPTAAQRPLLLAASCNPCAAKKKGCNPCNPCAAKKAACNPCNPCAAKKAACNPCNPCAAKKAACNPCNPCAAKKKY